MATFHFKITLNGLKFEEFVSLWERARTGSTVINTSPVRARRNSRDNTITLKVHKNDTHTFKLKVNDMYRHRKIHLHNLPLYDVELIQ